MMVVSRYSMKNVAATMNGSMALETAGPPAS